MIEVSFVLNAVLNKKLLIIQVLENKNLQEQLKNLTGICPSCGHEINNKIVNTSLKKFIDKVSELENNIDGYSAIEKKGWSTWNGGIRLGWILLNMLFVLITLVFYYIWKLISLVNVPKLEKEEKYYDKMYVII